MRDNPRDDWTIGDVEKVCIAEGLDLRKPSSGSHHVVVSARLRDVLTIPHKRPIKARYIALLVSYAGAHRKAENG